jgi:ADP-ribose pyrophosphatase YjhB (NUDIX family)
MEQRSMALPGDTWTLVCFNTRSTVVLDAIPIADVPNLTPEVYRPLGGTALLDAIADAAQVVTPAADDRVLCVVQTDGEENSSRRTTLDDVRKLVEERERAGNWTFVFLGAGIDAFASGAHVGSGTAMANSLSFAAAPAEMNEAWAVLSRSSRRYRAGASALVPAGRSQRGRSGFPCRVCRCSRRFVSMELPRVTRIAAYGLAIVEGRILLTRLSAAVSGYAGQWTLPGGGVEFGEHPEAAVVRELFEETGLRAHVEGLAGVDSQLLRWPDRDAHAIRILYRVTVEPGDLVFEAEGTSDMAAWFTCAEGEALPLLPVARLALRLAFGE